MEKEREGFYVLKIVDAIGEFGGTEGHPDDQIIRSIGCFARGYLKALGIESPSKQHVFDTILPSLEETDSHALTNLYRVMQENSTILGRYAYDPEKKVHQDKIHYLRKVGLGPNHLVPIAALIEDDRVLFLLYGNLKTFRRRGYSTIDDFLSCRRDREILTGIGPKKMELLKALKLLARENQRQLVSKK